MERYNARRVDGSTRTLDAVKLGASRFVMPHIYVTGQVHSAFDGDAGGYTAGLLGIGAQTLLSGRLQGGAEALIGAAGGGGVRTGGGVIAQPSLYVGFDVGPSLSVRAGVGRIQALRGGAALHANVVDVALAFVFGVRGVSRDR